MKKIALYITLLMCNLPSISGTEPIDCFHDQDYVKIAESLKQKGDTVQALQWYKKAVEKNPYNITANTELMLQYFQQEEYKASIQYGKNLLYVLPNKISLLFMQSKALTHSGQFNQAIELLEKIIQLDPNHKKAAMILGRHYIRFGEFEKGLNTQAPFCLSNEHQKSWDGSDLSGKTILLFDEGGGAGDVFFWVRYAYVLKDQGATVIVQARKSLVPILSQCPYINQVIPKGQQLPPFDFQTHIADPFRIVKTRLNTIPARTPYLFADKTLTHEWAKELSGDTNIKIGICWDPAAYANAATGKTIKNNRAMPLHCFYPLSKLKGVSLYSLQQKNGLDQLNQTPNDFKIFLFDDDFDITTGSFMDTAAVIKQLDLVITIDTSIAHLAGALGVPVWVILPVFSDWRWLVNKSNSPWYPTMRLFRQKNAGKWDSIMKQLIQELCKVLPSQLLQ